MLVYHVYVGVCLYLFVYVPCDLIVSGQDSICIFPKNDAVFDSSDSIKGGM